jgi:hypothetical protein
MHLGKRHEFSTLRRSLGSILASAHGLSAIDEERLTRWMHAHLRVTAIPVADADTLGHLETEILTTLDPPLNLSKVRKTPLRERLSALRKQYAAAVAEPNREEMNNHGRTGNRAEAEGRPQHGRRIRPRLQPMHDLPTSPKATEPRYVAPGLG